MKLLRFLVKLRRLKRADDFRSDAYWIRRYETGGNSGAGSYGRLADYKARVINDILREHGVQTVAEFGSSDGNQCSLLECPSYVGVDISPAAVAACRVRFADRSGWRFMTLEDYRVDPQRTELALSLDVIYHLVEDEVFEDYMARLFAAATRLVLIYSSDEERPSRAAHVRHRRYSDWVARNVPEFTHVQTWDQPYPMTARSDPKQTSFAHFMLFRRRDAANAGKRI